MSWANLRAAFPALSPAQLHRLLTQYQLASAVGPVSAWEPGAHDRPDAFTSGEPPGGTAELWGPGWGLPWRSPHSTWHPLLGRLPPWVPCPACPWGLPWVGVKEPRVYGQAPSSRLS